MSNQLTKIQKRISFKNRQHRKHIRDLKRQPITCTVNTPKNRKHKGGGIHYETR